MSGLCHTRRLMPSVLLWLLMLFGPLSWSAALVDPGPVVGKIAELNGEKLQGLRAVLQGKGGFLWLASNDGLLRFDGTSLRRYRHEPTDPASLPHNDVRAMVEDPDGFIWLATRGGGLARFSPSSGQFQRFNHQTDDPASLDSDLLNSLSLGKDGALWIGSREGINRFDRNTLTNTRFNSRMEVVKAPAGDDVQRIFEDTKGRLWFAMPRKGLYLHLPDSSKLLHFEKSPRRSQYP